jgi:hypothetical protein
VSFIGHFCFFLKRYKLLGDDIQRLHETEETLAIRRWPLTPGYIHRPDGVPLSESATEQAYEIFNGIAEEAEFQAKHHSKGQVNNNLKV